MPGGKPQRHVRHEVGLPETLALVSSVVASWWGGGAGEEES